MLTLTLGSLVAIAAVVLISQYINDVFSEGDER